MPKPSLIIALAGNPNAGKTTLFNALTGQRQHTGNYPGVTVEQKRGQAEHDGVLLDIVDLPGTYSLTAHSLDEVVARNFILEAKPHAVIDIVDASNLERNLYLSTQLLELGVPVVLAFNMADLAQARGYDIDIEKLSALLGVPIVPTVGHKGRGLEPLLAAAVKAGREGPAAIARARRVDYGREIEPHVRQMTEHVARWCDQPLHHRWFALKLLEDDPETLKRLRRLCPQGVDELAAEAAKLRAHIESVCGDAPEIILADRRYGFISGACTEAVRLTVEARHARSDKVDALLTNRYIGLPIFALMMYLVFQLTFAAGNPLVDLLGNGIGLLGQWVGSLWPAGSDSLLRSLLVDGIIGGVGAVLAFVPLIALLFLAIAFLEDSGYMARAAFLLDHLMHRIGLHGKSFIPMLIGFGCTVPGILATRTLDSRRDRLTTMLVLPLMSCGARLPVYVLILGAFFPPRTVLGLVHTSEGGFLLSVTNQALWLVLIYFIGIALAVIAARVLRATVLRGETAPFVMELPPYRMPTLKGLLVHMVERSWMYVRKAGTIILVIVVILWALASFPRRDHEAMQTYEAQQAAAQAQGLNEAELAVALDALEVQHKRDALEYSVVGRVGKTVAPVLRPCGFDWKISTAMLGAFTAKEVFIGQMGLIFAIGQEEDEQSDSLRAELSAAYTPLQGFCIMLFILIASPCVATVAATVRESGRWRWAAFQWAYLTLLAWAVTAAVYQVGRFFV